MSDFVPINIIKKKPRPAWMTPDFNPQIADKNFWESVFTPVSVIPKKSFLDIIDYAHNNSISQYPKKEQAQKERDAYRHILWTAMLAKKYGADAARTLGKIHESSLVPFVGGMGQPEDQRQMDLFNNDIGIALASQAKTLPEIMDLAKRIVDSGKAETNASPGTY